jgi:hypothetical protein
MQKKYIVRLTDQERNEHVEVVKKPKRTSQKVRRARIRLKADVDGPNWTDQRIAEEFLCRTKTVKNVRASRRAGLPGHAQRSEADETSDRQVA